VALPPKTSSNAETVWLKKIPELRAALRGEVVLPLDPGYDEARRVWNGMIDKRPALIVRCAGAADVVHCVKFARGAGLPVSARGGGHNVAGNALVEDGLVIDLSRMRSVRVDPERKTARVQGGCVWSDVDKETLAFGLVTTGGLVSSTGVAGFTLGGGIGWLMRKHGLACDNLLGVDVVTADATVVHASGGENRDLFYGVRGGGGNFGVVTEFEFRLHPTSGMVVGGLVMHRAQKAKELLRFWSSFIQKAPDELSTALVMVTCPPAPPFPADLQGKPVVAIAVCFDGPADAGMKALQPLKEFAAPEVDLVGPMPYAVLQGLFDPGNPPGSLNYWKSHYLPGLTDKAIDTIVSQVGKVPSALSEFHLQNLGGAVARMGEETAFAHRDAPIVTNIVGKWSDPKANDANIRWVREFWDALRPFATGGVYLNFLADATEEMARAAYGKEKWERLVAVKSKFDPTNFFRGNLNIPPKAR
jgi:hypothetical protein